MPDSVVETALLLTCESPKEDAVWRGPLWDVPSLRHRVNSNPVSSWCFTRTSQEIWQSRVNRATTSKALLPVDMIRCTTYTISPLLPFRRVHLRVRAIRRYSGLHPMGPLVRWARDGDRRWYHLELARRPFIHVHAAPAASGVDYLWSEFHVLTKRASRIGCWKYQTINKSSTCSRPVALTFQSFSHRKKNIFIRWDARS